MVLKMKTIGHGLREERKMISSLHVVLFYHWSNFFRILWV